MEQLNAKIYEKYTSLKKRKLLEVELERKREARFKEMHDAMKDWVSNLQKENEELSEELEDKKKEIDKVRMDLLEEIRARDSEYLRLKQLLVETNKNKSIATGSLDRTPEVILENPTPISPKKKTPQSNSKDKRVRLSEKASVPHSNPEKECRELECSRRHTRISGNGTNECSSAQMFHLLLQSLVHMKISLNDGTERFSISVSHEASGYSFTLTWLDRPDGGVWSYKLSTLGTLERVAVDWMKQDIRFSMNMCRRFFERISNIITKG